MDYAEEHLVPTRPSTEPERTLWIHVMYQAIVDGDKKYFLNTQHLFPGSFQWICNELGLNHKYLQPLALEAIKRCRKFKRRLGRSPSISYGAPKQEQLNYSYTYRLAEIAARDTSYLQGTLLKEIRKQWCMSEYQLMKAARGPMVDQFILGAARMPEKLRIRHRKPGTLPTPE